MLVFQMLEGDTEASVPGITVARVVSASAGTVASCPGEGREAAASISNISNDNEGFVQPASSRKTGFFLIRFPIARVVRTGYLGDE